MNYKVSMFVLAATLGAGLQANAAPITPDTIVGHYSVEASVPFQKVKIDFRVLNTKEFEITKIDRQGKPEETCNGTYVVNSNLAWDPVIMAEGRVFKGVFTCPSDRSSDVDFNIDFQGKTTDDLIQGTNVIVTTSLAPTRIKATVIKVKD